MIKINDNQFINEYEITRLTQVNDKYWISMSSGERFEVPQEIYENLKEKVG